MLVKDAQGARRASEVTLWAVDYGVLSLTALQDAGRPRSRCRCEKALAGADEDSGSASSAAACSTPKGGDEGGGGGEDDGPGTRAQGLPRARLLARIGRHRRRGHGAADVTLPESLTTYRIMAVAADKASRFGSRRQRDPHQQAGDCCKPAFPRFLARGRQGAFGAVVTSQLKAKGTAIVTMQSLDPGVLEVTGRREEDGADRRRRRGRGAVRRARRRAIGTARVQMTVAARQRERRVRGAVPVEVLVSPETVAAYGADEGRGRSETLELPAGVVPGLRRPALELASTALVGLGEGARYLVEYPYGCAEQRSSRRWRWLLAADLGDAFRAARHRAGEARQHVAGATLTELERSSARTAGSRSGRASAGPSRRT